MKTWATIGRALQGEQRCALVSIVEARGSAPRESGARMVVLEDGSFAGTIGGGTLEWQAIAHARDALAKGTGDGDPPPVSLERMALGPDLGQCCGGSVRILLEVFTPGRSAEVQALADIESAGPFATEGRIAERHVERTILDREPEGGEESKLEADGRLLERFGAQKQVLALIGAGHVGRAMIVALAPLDFSVVWIDPRDDAFPAIVPGDVRVVVAPAPAAELDAVPEGAFVLVMSHSHALDFDVVHAALRARRFGYVGPDRLCIEEGPLREPHAPGGARGRRYRAAGLPHRHRRHRSEAAGGHRRLDGRGPAPPQGRDGACGAEGGSLVPVTAPVRDE